MTEDQPNSDALRMFIQRNGSRRDLPRHARVHPAGDKLLSVLFVEAGWVARIRTTATGESAFMALHMAGDVVGADGLSGVLVDDDLIALTGLRVSQVSVTVLRAGAAADASLALALADRLGVETVFLREALFAVGRQPSIARLCTFFLQTYHRQVAAGLVEAMSHRYDLPLTQVELATATGMTPVHINRTLKLLRERKWLKFHGGVVHLLNVEVVRQQANITATLTIPVASTSDTHLI